MSEIKYAVVVGASAGGVNSIIELAAQMDQSVDMAMFVVLHMSHNGLMDHLVKRIQNNTELECKLGEHGESIKRGHIYIAAPEKHLLIKNNKILMGEGPAENRWRPSIDVLFRSAAVEYDGRAIGIILTGLMQDGTAGMEAIKRCGGVTIIQDPAEAEYPEMPLSVMNSIDVDYSVRLQDMGTIIREKALNGIAKHEVPADIKQEAALAERAAISLPDVKAIADYAEISCPDCGGGLWRIKDNNVIRFRCHTGHVYTLEEFFLKQHESLENTLWVALRMMEERRNLLKKISEEEVNKGWIKSASSKVQRLNELEIHIDRLKKLLFETKKD